MQPMIIRQNWQRSLICNMERELVKEPENTWKELLAVNFLIVFFLRKCYMTIAPAQIIHDAAFATF